MAVNQKITELTADTSPSADDLVVTVNDPGGTPANRKVTLANLLKRLFLADATQLLVTTVADGEFLKRSGTNITSGVPTGTGAETGANSDITSMDALTGALQYATRVDFSEGSAPSTPSANKVSLYAKSDGKVYIKDDTGTETDLTAATGLTADAVSAPVFAADAGANDTYTATLSPAPGAYTTGTHYRFKANTANTGACTINFNSLGAKTIKKVAGGITTDLADNDIRAGQWVDLVYDGTNMQMQSLLGNAPSGGGGSVADETVNVQSGTSYTVLSTDKGKLIVGGNASNQTVAIPDPAGAGFGNGFWFDIICTTGLAILDPAGSVTIDGAASYSVRVNRGVRVVSDGTNYRIVTGDPRLTGLTAGVYPQFSATSGVFIDGFLRTRSSNITMTRSDYAISWSQNTSWDEPDLDLRRGAAARLDVQTVGDYADVKLRKVIQSNGPTWSSGTGSPESVVTAPIGSLYSRTDGGAGTSLYVKESGAGNTGWVGK